MKIAFTICSNNYLAQAKTLGDSIKKNNPEYIFYIGLVDQHPRDINYVKDIGYDVIPVDSIGIENLDELWKKYDIVELNTCVKPMFFKFFLNKHKSTDLIFYFDPDIMILNSLLELENEFNENVSVLLTPHITTPMPIDNKKPFENTFLNYGIYNLGYLGLKNDSITRSLLDWWQERTVKFGFNKAEVGLFVDQLWFNLVPLFFHNVKISKHLGFNVAPWNLHERLISFKDGNYFVNNTTNLVFFHFSNYKYSQPDIIAKYYDRYQLDDYVYLAKLYNEYHQCIIKNNIEKFSKMSCYYVDVHHKYKQDIYYSKNRLNYNNLRYNKKHLIKNYLKKIIPSVLIRMYKAI